MAAGLQAGDRAPHGPVEPSWIGLCLRAGGRVMEVRCQPRVVVASHLRRSAGQDRVHGLDRAGPLGDSTDLDFTEPANVA